MPKPDRKPLFEKPGLPFLETGVDIRKVYAGNRVLAYIGGDMKTWFVQCLRCGRKLRRLERTLLRGKGQCTCRNLGSSTPSIYAGIPDTPDVLKRERKEWRRIVALYGDKVDPRWRDSFVEFRKDMGRQPPFRYLCRRTSLCLVNKENCFWGRFAQAEWKDRTIYLSWNGRTRRSEEVPGLEKIPRADLLRLLKRAPKYKTGEWIIKRWRRMLVMESVKKRDKARKEQGTEGSTA